MKRFLILVLLLALSVVAVPALSENSSPEKVGMLSMLNVRPEEMIFYLNARRIAARHLETGSGAERPEISGDKEIIYYDSLDAMLMALNAGEIDLMEIYLSTASYLCAHNSNLAMFDPAISLEGYFSQFLNDGIMSNDFAFMMLEKNTALRDEFDRVLQEISEDRDETLKKLAIRHILAPITGGDITPVEMPRFEGAETIRVAITGSLPPMDYIAPDGTPAGFNTALLAEISRRLQKNIRLVQVDSIGRAAALASGAVDVVFWTRTNARSADAAATDAAELEKRKEQSMAQMTDAEIEVLRELDDLMDFTLYGTTDTPEGTIVTRPYYSDTLVVVSTLAHFENRRGAN